jgi:LysM repeat protein
LNSVQASPGDDLYRISARVYGTVQGWTLIARANGLIDPLIQTAINLQIPKYSSSSANDGILSPP